MTAGMRFPQDAPSQEYTSCMKRRGLQKRQLYNVHNLLLSLGTTGHHWVTRNYLGVTAIFSMLGHRTFGTEHKLVMLLPDKKNVYTATSESACLKIYIFIFAQP